MIEQTLIPTNEWFMCKITGKTISAPSNKIREVKSRYFEIVRDFCRTHPSEGVDGALLRIGDQHYLVDMDHWDVLKGRLRAFKREVESGHLAV